jgi:hypothetical protein
MSRGEYRLVYDCPEVSIDFYMLLKDFINAFLILSAKHTDEEKPLHSLFFFDFLVTHLASSNFFFLIMKMVISHPMASWFVPVFRYFSGVRVVKCAKLHVFSILVLCRDVHLDFRITIMFGSSLPEFAL